VQAGGLPIRHAENALRNVGQIPGTSDPSSIVSGDLVQVGANQPLEITTVDYVAKTLTLAAPISFAAGDPVNLPSAGAAPDLGVFEHTPPSAQVHPLTERE
jgi:hypothetical protein